MSEEMKCCVCRKEINEFNYKIKNKGYCNSCLHKHIKKMKWKELDELEWRIRERGDYYNDSYNSYLNDTEWKLINRELEKRNYRKFWRMNYLTISIAIIALVISVVINILF